jgi:hypothetical protein
MGGGFESKIGGHSLVHDVQRRAGAGAGQGGGGAGQGVGKTSLTGEMSGIGPGLVVAPTLAEAGRGHLANRVGVDPGSVRVHEDGQAERAGARALATGRDLHFARGELHAPDADFLVGHELAHVVQQGHGQPATQAKREGEHGAGALEAEADRVGLAVARGETAAGTIVGRATAGAVQKFDSFEHKEIGDDATKGEHGETKTVELAPGYRVSYGEMIALAGDFFGSIEQLRAIAAVDGKGAGTREEIEYLRRVKIPNLPDKQQTALTKQFSQAAVHAADLRYYKLASSNASHFANPQTGDTDRSTAAKIGNSGEQLQEVTKGDDGLWHLGARLIAVTNSAAGHYRLNHLKAIGEAMAAGKAKGSIDTAMAANAFSDHYLTDSFSSGHNRTARTSISQYWNAKVPMFFVNFKGFLAEKLAYYINDHNTMIGIASVDMINGFATSALEETLAKKGMPDLQFGDLVSGTVHDYDNERGIAVKIDGADKRIYGDDNLHQGDTKEVVVRAVQASTADVEAAYETGAAGGNYDALYGKIAPRGMFRGEEMMPVVKPDAELAEADKSVKWDYPDIAGLISDPKFREGLKIFLRSKKAELASVGASLDAAYKREAFDNAIVAHLDGEAGVNMIWQILQWTPNTGGGIGGHNQDDNALDYFHKAKATAGGLASLRWEARRDLIKNLVDGYTSGDEEDAIYELLTSCASDGDLHLIINAITWDRLEDEVGDRFSRRYPKATYGKKAA